jgi:DNA-binding LytR/AlgR family response regulator
MLNIAICDDDEKARTDIDAFVQEYGSMKNCAIHSTCFSNASELLDNKLHFDIYLLDILMSGLNGIDLAVILRKNGDRAEIIFLTSSPEFALESYSVQALNYLLKPIDKKQLYSSLDRALDTLQKQKNDDIVIRSEGRLISVSRKDIEFVEARMDKVFFCMSNGETHETASSLSSFEDRLLSDSRFIKPHRAYIVNMSKIKELNGHDIHVSDCYPCIPIARGHFSEVKEAYLSYMTFQMDRGENK